MASVLGAGAGSAQTDAPVREATFFDKTETNYRNMEERAHNAIHRIDKICDSINGGQPREALVKTGGVETDRHQAAFDRCNEAESKMYGAMNLLEDAILRLENLGLT